MASDFKHRRVVEFAETDMAGIVHFSNFFRWMEATEHAFFRSLGFRIHGCEASGVWGWARRDARCEYLAPLRYEDEVEVQLIVRERRTRSIVYEFVFRLDGEVVARGGLTAVCVAKGEGGKGMRAVEIPASVAAVVEARPK